MDYHTGGIVTRTADGAEDAGRIIGGFLSHGCGDADADRTLAAMLTIVCRGMGAWDASSRSGRGRIVSMSPVITALSAGMPAGAASMAEPFSPVPGTWSVPDFTGGLVWMVTCHPRVFAPLADGMSRIAAMRPGVAMDEAARRIRRLGDIDASDPDMVAWVMAGGGGVGGPVPVPDGWLRRLYDVEGMEAMACIWSCLSDDYGYWDFDHDVLAMTAPEGLGWADIVNGIHDMAFRANSVTHGLWPAAQDMPPVITWRLMDAYSRGLCPMPFTGGGTDVAYWDLPKAEDTYVDGVLRAPDADAVRRLARAGVPDGMDGVESAALAGDPDAVAAAWTLWCILGVTRPLAVLRAAPSVVVQGMDMLDAGMPEGFVRETVLAMLPGGAGADAGDP